MSTKLILVEGVPGSGKSSTAKFIAEHLESQGTRCELFSEGELDHPADCEKMAYFTQKQFDEFVASHAEYEDSLRTAALPNGQDIFLSYGKLEMESDLPEKFIRELRAYEVYELPSATHCEVLLRRWDAFADYQANRDSVVVFECCYLQNALCHLFIRNGEGPDYIRDHTLNVCRAIQRLDPILFYLNPFDVNATINQVIKERPAMWLDSVIWYHTQQAYGRARGLSGVDGYVEVLKARRLLELDLLERLPLRVIRIDNPQSDWPRTHQEIENHLQAQQVR